MIIADGGLQSEIAASRMIAIDGSLGSGKTLIVRDVIRPWLSRGYRLLTNYRDVWADKPDDILPDTDSSRLGQRHAVVVVDEGGIWLRKYRDVARLSWIARKLDIVLVFSGRKLPHRDLCELVLSPYLDLWSNFLLPLRLWRYTVNATKVYHGMVVQAGWWSSYGLYSTLDPGAGAESILATVDGWSEYYLDTWGYGLSTLADALRNLPDDGVAAEISAALAGQGGRSAGGLLALFGRAGRR